jgi:hypothetical protein
LTSPLSEVIYTKQGRENVTKVSCSLKVAAALVGLTPIIASAGSVLKFDAPSVGGQESQATAVLYNDSTRSYNAGYGPQAAATTFDGYFAAISSANTTNTLSTSVNYSALLGVFPAVSSDTYFAVSADTAFNITGSFTGSGGSKQSIDFALIDVTQSNKVVYGSTPGTDVLEHSASFSYSGTLIAGDVYDYYFVLGDGSSGAGFNFTSESGSVTLSIPGIAPVPLPAPLYSGLALLPCAYFSRRWTSKSRA